MVVAECMKNYFHFFHLQDGKATEEATEMTMNVCVKQNLF